MEKEISHAPESREGTEEVWKRKVADALKKGYGIKVSKESLVSEEDAYNPYGRTAHRSKTRKVAEAIGKYPEVWEEVSESEVGGDSSYRRWLVFVVPEFQHSDKPYGSYITRGEYEETRHSIGTVVKLKERDPKDLELAMQMIEEALGIDIHIPQRRSEKDK